MSPWLYDGGGMMSTLEMAPLDMLMSNCFIFSSARLVYIYILSRGSWTYSQKTIFDHGTDW